MTDSGSDASYPHISDQPADVTADLGSVESFHNVVSFESSFKRLLPTLIMMFLITWLIATLVLAGVGVPVAGVFGAFVSGGFCALMTQLKKKQYARTLAVATLTLSPTGADMQDGSTRLQMSWSQVERIGEASTMDPLQAGGFHWLGAATGALSAASMRRKEMFLIGVGRISLDPSASVLVKAQLKQNFAGQDLEHAKTGVALAHFDEDWENGRIGQWIQAYRPDLMS